MSFFKWLKEKSFEEILARGAQFTEAMREKHNLPMDSQSKFL
jgi:hypothetical protein